MSENFDDEYIIIELKTLIDMAEDVQADIDSYCKFMKEMFLSTSGIN